MFKLLFRLFFLWLAFYVLFPILNSIEQHWLYG